MKKLKRLAAVLLAGIMALALFTACSDSDPGNPEFDPKVERAYQKALNNTFGTSFENDDAIKKLAVDYLQEVSGTETLNKDTLWKAEKLSANTVNEVMVCFDTAQSTNEKYVKFYYEANKAETITPDKMNLDVLKATWDVVKAAAASQNKEVELTALGVGAKTIGDKTYVAIGLGMKVVQ